MNKVEKSKNLTGSLINMGKPGKADQQKEAAVKKEGQSSKSETDHERSKAIKPEPEENLKLESRGRKMSAQQEQLLKKLQRGPTLISPPAQRVKEQRPKGRTIRKAHYDPHEVRYNCLNGFLPKGKKPRTIYFSPIIHAWDNQISIIFRCLRRKKRQSWRGGCRTIPSVEVGAEPAS